MAQQLSARLPGARLVKAFNTLFAPALEPEVHHLPPLVAFLSGDDQDAKDLVAGLVRDAGFDPLDIGGMSGVWRQEWFGPLYAKEYTVEQARAAVASIPSPRRGVA